MRDYTKIPTVPDSIWRNPLHFIAFGFGVGAMPFAPGTFGTLITIPFYLALQHLSLANYSLLVVLLIGLSSLLCAKVSRDIDVNDHQGMCVDEIIGFLVTMIAAPPGWIWIVIGVILFRIFDILKPWPISWVDQHLHSGFGMIFDDVLAGLCSCIIIQLLARLI